jgi:hypothetical protein
MAVLGPLERLTVAIAAPAQQHRVGGEVRQGERKKSDLTFISHRNLFLHRMDCGAN